MKKDIFEVCRMFEEKYGYEPNAEDFKKFIKDNNFDVDTSRIRELQEPPKISTPQEIAEGKKSSVIVLIWFFISFIALLYFAWVGQATPLYIIIGQYFFIFYFFLFLPGIEEKNKINNLPFLLGIILIILLFVFFGK